MIMEVVDQTSLRNVFECLISNLSTVVDAKQFRVVVNRKIAKIGTQVFIPMAICYLSESDNHLCGHYFFAIISIFDSCFKVFES